MQRRLVHIGVVRTGNVYDYKGYLSWSKVWGNVVKGYQPLLSISADLLSDGACLMNCLPTSLAHNPNSATAYLRSSALPNTAEPAIFQGTVEIASSQGEWVFDTGTEHGWSLSLEHPTALQTDRYTSMAARQLSDRARA
eukprot:45644-Amphidinium_carterae.1